MTDPFCMNLYWVQKNRGAKRVPQCGLYRMTTEIIILPSPPSKAFFLVSGPSPLLYVAMGLFSTFIDSFCEHCSTQSIYTLALVGGLSFIALSVVVNVLRQLLFKNPHEPPVVFHWFPFVGSTISYGIDPYKFFNTTRAKVCLSWISRVK